MKIVSFSLEQGDQYYGKIDGQRFLIGARVPYDGKKGLMNLKGTAAQRYDRAIYRPTYGFWADFIHPTATAEGGLYHALNTYDDAHFTFTFLQYAAHVPDGDFVMYLRELLQLPLALEYFPDLVLAGGRICKVTSNGSVALESSISTDGLVSYLNPSVKEVEDTEVIQAAKFVYWAQNDPLNREAQIKVGVDLFKKKMLSYANRYGLDGASDAICLLVCDIRHQGRAKTPAIISALQSSKPLEALLKIGEPKYHSRLVVLRSEINRLTAEGILGVRKYSKTKADFVP
ncbi:hypothetical protein [Nevskia ramosa]|uniref:hypothetical protein n=1 Tax=Nevskia ramosa TaxID=64002 RepID=UPI003D0EABCD